MSNTNSKTLTLIWAMKYLKAGLSVIPCHAKTKIPTLDWGIYQKRLPTESEIQQWFSSGNLNLGIVAGALSNLAVIDMDGSQGISEGRRMSLSSPVSVFSGNGKHLWFKYTDGLRNSASKIAEGVDIRGEGGFIMAPPSQHENGKFYRFATLSPVQLRPSFPSGLLIAGSVAVDTTKPTVKEPNWIDEALEDFKNGHIANTLVSILGKFRAHNFSEDATFKFLQPHNTSGKLENDELRSKISEIWGRYEPNPVNSRPMEASQPSRFSSNELVIRSPDSEADFRVYEADIKRQSIKGDLTGFPSLDKMLEGGLKSERLFTIAARTGENKTNTTLAIAKSLCEQNKKVLYFSTEFSFRKIWERYINQLKDASEFRKHPFHVCDSFSPDLNQVEAAIQKIKPEFFVFDHINHVAEDVKPLGEFMQGCNFLMRKHGCQGLVIAQLNRSADWVEGGQRVEPRLSMLKGSGTLEQASSRVLLLSEMRVSPEFDEIRAVLAKNDAGTKGIFMLALRKNPYRIEELLQ